jgi:hypothetical protein
LNRLILVVMAVSLLASCREPAVTQIDRFNVTVTIRPDGSLLVRETIALGPVSEPQVFERAIAGRFDEITLVSATLDGGPIDAESAAGTVDVSSGSRLRFRIPRSAGAPVSVLDAAYRVRSALRLRGPLGILEWPALPPRRSYAVGESRLEVFAPPGTLREGSVGVAEAGWTVTRLASGIAAERDHLVPEEGATLMATVRIDPSAMIDPQWQYDEERRAEFVPAFLSAGLFFLVVGAGIVWIVRWQYPRPVDRGARWPTTHPEIARNLRAGAWFTLATAVFSGVTIELLLSRFGAWPHAISMSLAVVALSLYVAGRR